jgi:hypothetical protein
MRTWVDAGAVALSAVAGQFFFPSRLQATESAPATPARWWDQLTSTPGCPLSPNDIPWAMIAPERFEAIKTPGPE